MKNKILTESIIFISVLLGLFIFFKSSISTTAADTQVIIRLDDTNFEDNKKKVETYLTESPGVSSVNMDTDDFIVLEVESKTFKAEEIKQYFKKWDIEYQDDFDISIIASAI